MKKLLNIGCGHNYHKDWINADVNKTGDDVIAVNILEGLPFENNEIDVIYSSHMIEHMPKKDVEKVIDECFRVMSKGGIIRLVVPDLEQIAKLYLENLNKAANGDKEAENNYDWMMLEMYDQSVREKQGGEMLNYFVDNIDNLEFPKQRIGNEVEQTSEWIKKHYLPNQNKPQKSKKKSLSKRIKGLFKKTNPEEDLQAVNFRRSGELHKWMYDRFSLARLLKNAGFKQIEVKTAFESSIENWDKYELDAVNKTVKRPDSLFIEGRK